MMSGFRVSHPVIAVGFDFEYPAGKTIVGHMQELTCTNREIMINFTGKNRQDYHYSTYAPVSGSVLLSLLCQDWVPSVIYYCWFN